MTAPAPLLRLSQLARFWEKNPRTIMGWIRQGRLAALRSPGNHFRVRIADVRAFCEREGMPVPPFVAAPPPRRVVVAAAPAATGRAVVRALKAPGILVEARDPYDALVAVAGGATALLVLGAPGERFDAAEAIAALRRAPATAGLLVVATATTRSRVAALEQAGATRVLVRPREDELARVVRELLVLD